MRSLLSQIRTAGFVALLGASGAWAHATDDVSFEDVRTGRALHEVRHAITWQRLAAHSQPAFHWSGPVGSREQSPWRAYEQFDAWAGWRLMPGLVGHPALRVDAIPWLHQPVNFGHWRVPTWAMQDIPCVVPVPEPASATLALAGGLALWTLRRRRHRG